MPQLKPRVKCPPLDVSTVGGGQWSLADQSPENFTLIVVYRGLHCPVCKSYLQTLDAAAADYREKGVHVIAVSADTEDKASKAREEWGIEKVQVGYGLTRQQMDAWGLYVSEVIKDEEMPEFAEPGLFLVRPDQTLYYAAYNSMPFGRPDLKDFVKSVGWVLDKDYPARGEG